VIVSAAQHAPDSAVVRIDAPSLEMNFELERVYIEEACRAPYLSIPDDNPAGVSDQMSIERSAIIEAVEVYVDIDHTYQGDLVVRLTSPEGTVVTLHNRTGDIHGWYPDELIPFESLDVFVGENCQGTWTLFVADYAHYDHGTLREWCLRITYPGEALGVDAAAEPRLALGQNVPNPFNPSTTLTYQIAEAEHVRLAVFDVGGRRVRALVDRRDAPGEHTVAWDGLDDVGRRLGSGVFFYRLEVGSKTIERRMILLR
jgi:subtilisin-like proprotein convertase family protein